MDTKKKHFLKTGKLKNKIYLLEDIRGTPNINWWATCVSWYLFCDCNICSRTDNIGNHKIIR